MNELMQKAISGALSGLLAAAIVDIDAWKQTGKFDWALASRRWLAGAVFGASSALGLNLAGGAE